MRPCEPCPTIPKRISFQLIDVHQRPAHREQLNNEHHDERYLDSPSPTQILQFSALAATDPDLHVLLDGATRTIVSASRLSSPAAAVSSDPLELQLARRS